MSRFLDGLDLGFQELLGLKVENRDSAPDNPESGYVYFDTTEDSYRLYQNGTWFELAASGVLVGAASARPVASAATVGTLFWATDESALYVDEGGSWSLVDGSSGGGVAVSPSPPSAPEDNDLWVDTSLAVTTGVVSSRELDYAESTAAVLAEATTNVVVDAPGLTVSYDFDGVTPVILEVSAHVSSNYLSAVPLLFIRDASDNSTIAHSWGGTPSVADHFSSNRQIVARRRITPPAGPRTYKIGIMYVGTAGTGRSVQIQAGAAFPAHFRIVAVDV